MPVVRSTSDQLFSHCCGSRVAPGTPPTERSSGCSLLPVRVGEAIGLGRDDVDLSNGVLSIREAKFDRERLVPLHPSTTDRLRCYAACRDRLTPTPRSSADRQHREGMAR